jgi:hypothetical protein
MFLHHYHDLNHAARVTLARLERAIDYLEELLMTDQEHLDSAVAAISAAITTLKADVAKLQTELAAAQAVTPPAPLNFAGLDAAVADANTAAATPVA